MPLHELVQDCKEQLFGEELAAFQQVLIAKLLECANEQDARFCIREALDEAQGVLR